MQRVAAATQLLRFFLEVGKLQFLNEQRAQKTEYRQPLFRGKKPPPAEVADLRFRDCCIYLADSAGGNHVGFSYKRKVESTFFWIP